MAEQAQKEPTMEEILSSIRKIIADDDTPEASIEAEATEDSGVFEDDLMAAEPDMANIESEDDVLAAISQSMEEAAEEFDANADAEDSFEFVVEDDSFDSFEDDAFDGVEDFAEPEVELAPVEETFDPVPEPQPEPVIEKEVPMTANAAPLTDTATVTAAAGALGKLLANVEFGEEAGGATTIEGLVREMLRPMLKEWLDENLPGIVEKHVEAEVQRIARMAG